MFDYTFQWRSALRALPDMLAGALVTFETAALSMIFGVLIALALTVMRESKNPLLRGAGEDIVFSFEAPPVPGAARMFDTLLGYSRLTTPV